jgi:hypothetical protein
MKERPIIFSAAMVRALLDGRKTQTRRIVKPQPAPATRMHELALAMNDSGTEQYLHGTPAALEHDVRCPYGVPGDRLWVKETFRGETPAATSYRADDPGETPLKWTSSIFMGRPLSRLTLEVIDVRVEPLHDLDDEDAIAEGLPDLGDPASVAVYAPYFDRVDAAWASHDPIPPTPTPVERYRMVWTHINGAASWDVNPWVWVVSFRVV